jgi:hypothetical protein
MSHFLRLPFGVTVYAVVAPEKRANLKLTARTMILWVQA